MSENEFTPGDLVKDRYLEGTVMRVTRVDEQAGRVHFIYLHSGLEGSYNAEHVIRYMELADGKRATP